MSNQNIETSDELLSQSSNKSLKQYINEISKFPVLSMEEQKNLYKKYIEDKDELAKEALINSNLHLVVNIAFSYRKKVNHLQILDLIQEGNMGLIDALKDYNPDLGAFSTHSYYKIKKQILRSIYVEENEIRKPIPMVDMMNRYYKLKKTFDDNRMLLTDDIIKDKLQIAPQTLDSLKKALNQNIISINQKILDDDKEMEEYIADDKFDFDNIDKNIDNNLFYIALKELLRPDEYFIMYYHLLIENPLTLKELVPYFNMSGEGIRTIERKAKIKCKNILGNNSIRNKLLHIIKNEQAHLYCLKKTPLNPHHIVLFLYMKNELNLLEQKLYYLLYLDKYTYTQSDLANKLGIDISKLNNLNQSLKEKIANKDSNLYSTFKDNILNQYGINIYNIDLTSANENLSLTLKNKKLK